MTYQMFLAAHEHSLQPLLPKQRAVLLVQCPRQWYLIETWIGFVAFCS